MQLLVYRLVYPLIWCISKLPWKLFYLFSDFVYILTYYIVGYRRKTVTSNLVLAFPDKSPKEIARIRKAFYKHMCDMFLEMVKSLSITEEELKERFKLTNIAFLRTLEAQNKSALVMYAHYASYEWSNSIDLISSFACVGIYKKIANPHFDALLQRIRARFGSPLIESKNVIRKIIKDRQAGKLHFYGMISDQTPKMQNASYWRPFMGVTVPMFLGTQILSKKLDLPVYYMKVTKKKRGFYEAEFVPITTHPKNCGTYEIVDTYTRLLEEQIYEQPEYYLWTHKRWKFKDFPKPSDAVIKE